MGKTFTGEMLVALSGERTVFYDIVKIKEDVSPTGTNSRVLPETGESTSSTISITENSEKSTVSEEKSSQNLSAEELDTYARENIEGYNKLGAANQSMIRSIIRQGRAAGVEESFVLSCARVSAHSGLNIVFSKELCFVKEDGSFADGSIDLKNNRIIINPEAKGRSGEEILIHELTHAIYNMSDGTLQVAEGLETMSAEEKERIRKRYSEVGHGSAVEVSDEINAHFAEETLANKDILERLVKKKPTLKQKILGFFKGARADYASDAGLSGAAKRLYLQYSKLFEEFSQRNALTNASEGGISIRKKGKRSPATMATEGARMALPKDIIEYSDEERTSIESNSKFIVANSLTDVIEFYNSAVTGEENGKTTMFVGKFSTQTAAKVKKATGISVFNKSIALNWSDLRHIKAKHGNANSEALRGQIGITSQNFSQIIDAIASPDNVRAEVDEKSGLTSIIFLKQSKGETTAVTILSEKKKSLTLKSAWITKEKQRISPPSNAEALNTTSETLQSMNATSTNSIAQNSEKSTDSEKKGGKNVRYALPRSDGRRLDNYSVLQYNNFGWVRANDVISPRQWADFNSKFTQAKNGREQFVKTKSGDFIIPVNDMAGDSFGVDNVLVYARGSLENPKIGKIVKINLANETDIDIIRSDIYAYEKRGNTQTSSYVASLYGEEFIREYTQQTVRNYQEYKAAIGARSGGAESRGVDGAHLGQQNRSRNSESDKRYALSKDGEGQSGRRLSEAQWKFLRAARPPKKMAVDSRERSNTNKVLQADRRHLVLICRGRQKLRLLQRRS